jgi:hypothetical protein
MSIKYTLQESDTLKILRSDIVNYDFNKKTGFMATWGKTLEENPDFSPVGPFIADIEISTICHGIQGKPCKFCYKSNTGVGENMSLETFKKVFHNIINAKITLGTDCGEVTLKPSSMVKLIDGRIISAEEIAMGDNIAEII